MPVASFFNQHPVLFALISGFLGDPEASASALTTVAPQRWRLNRSLFRFASCSRVFRAGMIMPTQLSQQQRPQGVSKPVVGGNIKALFGPLNYVLRKLASHQVPEHELEPLPGHLQGLRQRRCELSEAVTQPINGFITVETEEDPKQFELEAAQVAAEAPALQQNYGITELQRLQ